MVFGLFSRKSGDTKPTDSQQPQQLRTPSPSVVDSSSARVEDSSFPPITPSPTPERVTDPSALRALIQSIPPKTLQSYTLSHLATASPEALTYISTFFSNLAPPPTLHCVRCHKGYFEVENNDRSCLIGHDDESAEVERVGKGAGYETLWGCCGKTVDGDGDMGPPDGWCYEGMHTTDLKRARFRADSTIHDDKLTSCGRLRCHDPEGRASRKRARRAAEADSDDSDSDSDGASHSSVRTRSRATKKARTVAEAEDSDDEMPAAESSSLHASPRSVSSKHKPRAKSVSSTTSTRAKPAVKSRKPRSTAPSSPPSPSKKAVSMVGVTSTSSQVTETQTQTLSVSVVPASKVKGAMQPKSKPRPKQPKRLNEVVESSVAGEVA